MVVFSLINNESINKLDYINIFVTFMGGFITLGFQGGSLKQIFE